MAPTTNEITLLSQPWDHPDGVYLRAKQRVEILSLGGDDPGTPPTASNVPIFLIAYISGTPVGCGGLRPLHDSSISASDDAAEIKRMFVDAAYRGDIGNGTSVARWILQELEVEARRIGCSVLVLETGDFLVKARRFYEKCGFVRREKFGSYTDATHSVFYEKRINKA
ncbi:acyl-CoA N-acyltransferase [Phaeosphaeriaceae sp. SRC1lsM3a]|nr:acyl-CoA N-acyltransferase [Stagonospora sp. SRC1lsM3a]